jgi:hypothetical protein
MGCRGSSCRRKLLQSYDCLIWEDADVGFERVGKGLVGEISLVEADV